MSNLVFTGKEEDVEVGLQYFGKRFLNPLLGRWISADPLAVHAPGSADLNLYAYVSGAVLKNVDPLGLEEEEGALTNPNPQTISSGEAEEAAGVAPTVGEMALGVLATIAMLGLALLSDEVRGLFGPSHRFEPSKDGFATSRETADWAISHYQKLGDRTQQEYGGYIHRKDGRFYLSDVARGGTNAVDPYEGHRMGDYVIGTWHIHPGDEKLNMEGKYWEGYEGDVPFHDISTGGDSDPAGPGSFQSNPNNLEGDAYQEWAFSFETYMGRSGGKTIVLRGPFAEGGIDSIRQQRVEHFNSKMRRGTFGATVSEEQMVAPDGVQEYRVPSAW